MTLYYTQGLPGAGKTTWTRVFTELRGAVYVSTDQIRKELYGRLWVGVHAEADEQVRQRRDAAIREGLAAGRHVVVDGTHLTPGKVARLEGIAAELDVDIRCLDFTGVPMETCLQRAQEKGGAEDDIFAYIRRLHAQYIAPRYALEST